MNVGSPAEETEKRRKEGEERLAGGVRVRVIVSFFMINRTRTYYGRWPVPIKNSASSSDFTKRYTRERVYVHISVYEYLVPLKNLCAVHTCTCEHDGANVVDSYPKHLLSPSSLPFPPACLPPSPSPLHHLASRKPLSALKI